MENNRADKADVAEKEATVPSELPQEVRRVAPEDAPSSSLPTNTTAATGTFANVQLRPEGQRYGDADLVPGGSLAGNGGMMMNERNFPRPGMGTQGDPYGMPGGRGPGGQPRFDGADGYARFDPMFPGQLPRGGGRGNWSAPRVPGEPDDDNFFPPGGRPGEPFGGPGGGQFGPRGGNFGGWGGQGGGNSPWA
ncbi:hypothetical protein N2W54_007342 [Lotmaria passim]